MRGSRLTLLDKGGDPYLWSKENIFSRNGSREAILEIGYLRRYINGYSMKNCSLLSFSNCFISITILSIFESERILCK